MDIIVKAIEVVFILILVALFIITLPGLVNQKRYDKDEKNKKEKL